MGSAASSAYAAHHGLVHEKLNKQEQQQQQQQQPPKLLTVTLAGGEEDLSGDDTDDSPPRLIDATDHVDDLDQDTSREVCRKALLLPTTHAQHVGRLVVKPGCGTSTGQVVWVVPARALGGASSPQSPTAAATGPTMCTTPANITGPEEAPARVLLSPTFILPCGLSGGCRGESVTQLGTPAGQGEAPSQSSTEWQLMLEPSTVSVSSPPSPQLAPSSPTCTSTTNTAADPDCNDTGSPAHVTAQSGGPDKVQIWTPTIRFLWSPACNTTSAISQPAPSALASQTASPVAAVAGAAHAGSLESSDPGRTATNQTGSSSSSSSNSSESDPMDTSVPDSSSSGGSGIGSLIKDAEKKLLPSSWSIRKKNLAPASYRAAYPKQPKGGVTGSTLAPAAGSLTQTIPADAASSGLQDQGRHSQLQDNTGSTGSGSSSSSWCLRCSGKLAVTLGAFDAAAAAADQDMDQGPGSSMQTLRASAGCDVELQEFGGTWGAPFSLGCKHTPQPNSPNGSSATDAATSSISSNTQQLQLSILEHGSGASGSAWDRAAGSGHPKQQGSKVDELCIAVDFDQLQLLLEPNSKAITPSSTDRSNNSSTAHQKHPQGLSPPHTPNKASSSSNTAAEHASDGSSDTAAHTAPAAAPAVLSRPSRLPRARQLEAFLLSHSPRMLVIDNFFSPGLCNDLMELARNRLVRSRVASGSETPSRTSWGHFFVKDAAKHHLIVEAESQIEALFNSAAVRGGYGPLAKVEALQVVRYHKGEFYHEHYDNRADGPLTRAATILVYLCDTEEGGATSFSRAVTGFGKSPDADAQVLPPKVTVGPGGRGIKIFPVQGRALVFWSKRPNGDEDPNSIHAADTVVAGEKWIATRWMKDNL